MNSVAVDIGKSGGFAWKINGEIGSQKMPETSGDVLSIIESLIKKSGNEEIAFYLEKVGGYGGNNKGTGSAMFSFGFGCGILHGILMAKGVRVILITPQKWQKPLGLGTATACASKTIWKNKLKAEAQRRYPTQKITLCTSDAFLILDYALYGGNNSNENDFTLKTEECNGKED